VYPLAVTPVYIRSVSKHLIVPVPAGDVVAARTAVDHVVARTAEERVWTAKAAYFVVAVLTGQLIHPVPTFVGAFEQATLVGAAR